MAATVKGLRAISAGYDCRILFTFLDENTAHPRAYNGFCIPGEFTPAKVGNSCLQFWGASSCKKCYNAQPLKKRGLHRFVRCGHPSTVTTAPVRLLSRAAAITCAMRLASAAPTWSVVTPDRID